MALNEFGIKELYDVKLKATYPIEIGKRYIEEGETICFFDNIQIANFQEIKSYITAHGGYEDRAHVWWESTKEVNFVMERGIFSKTQFALLSNSRLINIEQGGKILIPAREEVESNDEGIFELKENPYSNFYIYNLETGEKITAYTKLDNKTYQISESYASLIVDYNYEYENGGSVVNIGQRLIKGYLRLEGRTKIKDDVTGQTHTGIIIIPKLKLMSDLSMSLGEKANPVVGKIQGKIIPESSRADSRVIEMYFLNDDIDSDI